MSDPAFFKWTLIFILISYNGQTILEFELFKSLQQKPDSIKK